MAKTGISFYFTMAAPGYKDKVTVCASDPSGKRKYMRVEGLDYVDVKAWDKNLQLFLATSKNNIANNAKLVELRVVLEILIRITKARDAEHLLALYKDGKGDEYSEKQTKMLNPVLSETLGEYLKTLTDKLRTEGLSRHYQLYQTLYHNLMGVSKKFIHTPPAYFEPASYDHRRLCDTPISEISNEHLAAFADWIKTEKNGSNYRNLTVHLMATLRRAQSEGKNKNELTYSFTKNAPKKTYKSLSGAISDNKPNSLTAAQIKAVFEFDASTVSKTPDSLYWNNLYLDTARLMYLLMSRPADVVSMTWDMVVTKGEQHFLYYIPYKKRGYKDANKHIVKMPIPEEAMKIILKYKGRSKTDAILPFPDNDRKYRFDTPEGAQEWSKALSRSIRKVDSFLKHVGKALKLRWSLSLYAFRRSAITHSLDSGQNIMSVAKRAGTGLAMIDRHYYQDQGIV